MSRKLLSDSRSPEVGVGRNRVSEVNYQKVKKKVTFLGLHVAERGFLPILGSNLENSLIPPLFSVAMLGHFGLILKVFRPWNL